jgi:hypothetical protein
MYYDVDKSINITDLLAHHLYEMMNIQIGNREKQKPFLKFMNRESLARENIVDEQIKNHRLIVLGNKM